MTVWLSGKQAKKPLVEDVMTSNIQTVRDDQPLLDLVPMLSDLGFHQLPVVDVGGQLVGIITQSDVIAGLYWELTRQVMEKPS